MGFNLDNYETVEDRLVRFWNDHPNGRIYTEMVHYDDNKVVFKTSIFFDAADENPKATGFAEEVRGASPVNKTSHLENAETSSTGRGLANCGYAPKGARPSREEMQKVQRGPVTPQPATTPAPVRAQLGLAATKPAENTMSMAENMTAMREITRAFGETTEVRAERPGAMRVKNTTDPATRAQVGKLVGLAMSQNYSKEERLEMASAHSGRDIKDLNDLTKLEASELISILSAAAAPK